MERSALGMLYGKQIDIKLPVRTPDQITRSRGETKNDKFLNYVSITLEKLMVNCMFSLKNLKVVEIDLLLYLKSMKRM